MGLELRLELESRTASDRKRVFGESPIRGNSRLFTCEIFKSFSKSAPEKVCQPQFMD